jgi:hypothetical protein
MRDGLAPAFSISDRGARPQGGQGWRGEVGGRVSAARDSLSGNPNKLPTTALMALREQFSRHRSPARRSPARTALNSIRERFSRAAENATRKLPAAMSRAVPSRTAAHVRHRCAALLRGFVLIVAHA